MVGAVVGFAWLALVGRIGPLRRVFGGRFRWRRQQHRSVDYGLAPAGRCPQWTCGAAILFAWVPLQAATAPDIVYLNRCVGTCAVQAGADDAINAKSSVVSSSVSVAAFPWPDATFDATAACVRTVLAPYDIIVRITSPGALARREIMLTTTSQSIGLFSGLYTNAPFDGYPHDNTIGFVFSTTVGSDVQNLCWETALVIGNLYRLDIVIPCADIMSFDTGCGVKSFTNQDAACANIGGQCILGNSTQNSAAILGAAPGLTDILFANGTETFQLPSAGPAP